MSSNPLGGRVNNDISTVVDWADEITASAEGVVNDQWNACVVGNFGQGLKVWDSVLWITDRLNVECLGLLIDGSGESSWLNALNELGLNSQSWEKNL